MYIIFWRTNNECTRRYGAKPNNFCVSYEEIRTHDIREDGTDQASHKNDEQLSDITLGLDERSLRQVFTSIGLADKDGNFPINSLLEKSKKINEFYAGTHPEMLISKQFSILREYCPEFASCQNSTMGILTILLNSENLNFNKCVVNRVYEKEDEDKRPVLYMYIDLPQIGKKFYYADKEKGIFVESPQKEFEDRFECYEMDMEKQEGHRPWEDVKTKENVEDLNKSSGKVVVDRDGREEI